MDPEVNGAMQDLRAFMFQRVYRNPVAKGEESKAKAIIRQLYEYYIRHPQALPAPSSPSSPLTGWSGPSAITSPV